MNIRSYNLALGSHRRDEQWRTPGPAGQPGGGAAEDGGGHRCTGGEDK